jgi:hypothetical protein
VPCCGCPGVGHGAGREGGERTASAACAAAAAKRVAGGQVGPRVRVYGLRWRSGHAPGGTLGTQKTLAPARPSLETMRSASSASVGPAAWQGCPYVCQQAPGPRVWGSGFRWAQGLGFDGSGFRVLWAQDLGFDRKPQRNPKNPRPQRTLENPRNPESPEQETRRGVFNAPLAAAVEGRWPASLAGGGGRGDWLPG